ncbi:MAG: NTP transferase domain-containing protein [Ruminococcus sp.]|nr:NTP transferase domain-containing protein [Ruminococcus sp.]
MNNVERAIILAAGKGSRMRPLTNTIPKPLLKVFGQPIIEHSIELLLQKGISEIYVVVGYLSEQFNYLIEKYNITIIKNDMYDVCNNISSLYLVRDNLENAIVMDGDIWISDSDVILTSFDCSGYTSIWTDSFSNEWIQITDIDGYVKKCFRNGYDNGWILYSISYWSSSDAKQLKEDIKNEYITHKQTDIFWDDVAMFCYPEKYQLKIKPVSNDAIREFDTINELASFDKSYMEVLL